MQLIITILLIACLVVLVLAIQRNRIKAEDEKIRPDEVGLIAELGLEDEKYRLDYILKQTWAYFDAHPGANELTEIHSIVYGNACQVFEEKEEDGQLCTVIVFGKDDQFPAPDCLGGEDNQQQVVLKGLDAREKAAGIIKEYLQVSDESRLSYQLAGSDGPDHYFTRL